MDWFFLLILDWFFPLIALSLVLFMAFTIIKGFDSDDSENEIIAESGDKDKPLTKEKKIKKPKVSKKEKNTTLENNIPLKPEIDLEKVAWNANGSGIIISNDGYIATNNHVILSDKRSAKNIGVEFVYNDEIRTFRARVIKKDSLNDLAIIKIDDKNFKPIGHIPYSIKRTKRRIFI